MSYDVSIGNQEYNYTFNLARFFHEHIINDEGTTGLASLKGMTGYDAGVVLLKAFQRIDDERMRRFDDDRNKTCIDVDSELYQIYTPDNGWGSYTGALIFLSKLMASCFVNPNATVEVCQ